ncbi:Bax inhibitor-1/YccA family protein [Streptomyces sp. VRA16 Mangrove soil]|uniref:Bax inhibitor-1/YccA family membrane protein n=1 Tax=Streptomyces sp. VRA16 Mangrove soil TaxID=2817434 RepID=UPI001A9CC1A0|nr:Bax inhibitor-1/YccA family protein [Streptomyces sp. VRA16 Mangrove soil]MBO1329841.1 Bax inhibitor-1/YccA family protein [Streptomyces sp. VRA16 Mangrove soil]
MTPVVQQRSLTSSNPVLSRPQFGRRGGPKTAARDPRTGTAVPQGRTTTGQDPFRADEPASLPFPVADLMTSEGVVSRAAAGLAVSTLAAILVWTALPHTGIGTSAAYAIAAGAGLAAAALVVLQRHRKRSSSALTLTFAAVQGVFLAVLSATASSHLSPGVFVQLVLGTMAACAGVLCARALHWMRAGRRWWPSVGAGLLGLGFLALADLALVPFIGAAGLGLRPAGLAVLMGVLGVVLTVPFLSLHFGKVADGIACGAPQELSWTAAFGLTLTLTWLYVETVRLLTLYPADELY